MSETFDDRGHLDMVAPGLAHPFIAETIEHVEAAKRHAMTARGKCRVISYHGAREALTHAADWLAVAERRIRDEAEGLPPTAPPREGETA